MSEQPGEAVPGMARRFVEYITADGFGEQAMTTRIERLKFDAIVSEKPVSEVLAEVMAEPPASASVHDPDEFAALAVAVSPARTDLSAHPIGPMSALAGLGRAIGHAIVAGDLTAQDAAGLADETVSPLIAAWNDGGGWPL